MSVDSTSEFAEEALDSDLLDLEISPRRKSKLSNFDKYLVEKKTGSNLALLAPSVLHNINSLYEEGTITRLQRAKIKAHILRQSDPATTVSIETHFRRRSLLVSASASATSGDGDGDGGDDDDDDDNDVILCDV